MPKPRKPKMKISSQELPPGVPWLKKCSRCNELYGQGLGCCPSCLNPEFEIARDNAAALTGEEELEAIEMIAASLEGYPWRTVSLVDLQAINTILEGVAE